MSDVLSSVSDGAPEGVKLSGFFDIEPSFGLVEPEPSLRIIIRRYYRQVFDRETADRYTGEYIEALLGAAGLPRVPAQTVERGCLRSILQAIKLRASLAHASPADDLKTVSRLADEAMVALEGLPSVEDGDGGRGFKDGLPQPMAGTAEGEPVAVAIRSFAEAILHGDDEHRGWLTEAAEEFIAGRPMPPARGKGAPTPPALAHVDAISVQSLIEDAGCTSAADLVDMARVGSSLLARIDDVRKVPRLSHWGWSNDPAEIVTDLANMLEDDAGSPGDDPKALAAAASLPSPTDKDAEIARVVEALEPFSYAATEYERYHPAGSGLPDDWVQYAPITMKDLRRARATWMALVAGSQSDALARAALSEDAAR